jgi:hypothetical protein
MSSFLIAVPEVVAAAATDLSNIGSTIGAANTSAAAGTMGLLPAAADEVSAVIAALFNGHAQAYQALSTQAALFHQQFVQLMNSAGSAYAAAEAANASPLQAVRQEALAAINAPAQALFDRPLIGNGADGTASSLNGQDGGILYGNGGAGTAGVGGSGGSLSGMAGTDGTA